MPRLAYRNFGSYESFLVSHTVELVTGGTGPTAVRWYELRGSGTPAVFQSGTVNLGKGMFRFMPSIAQDHVANMAVGYSVSGSSTHPSIAASYTNLQKRPRPTEISLWSGTADEENSYHWGVYTSMTIDPVDDCTFWYVNEYFDTPQTGSAVTWQTRISHFVLPNCN